MTPSEWNIHMRSDNAWQLAYAVVEREARAHLTANPCFDAGCTTDELVEALYPAKLAIGDGILARKRMFKALKALATRGLADCATRGAPRVLGNRAGGIKIRPWLWHDPTEPNSEAQQDKKTCPHCGKEIT